MILKRAELRNIKSYYPEEIVDFDNKINLFVGPNAGGKSNLFEIIQGVINNILFKHVNLKVNPNRTNSLHQDNNITYLLAFDNIDQLNIQNNLLDKHFGHLGDLASVYLIFKITQKDTSTLNILKLNKDYILQRLRNSVAGATELINLIEQLNDDTDFSFLRNQEIKLYVSPHENLNIGIADYAPFPTDKHPLVNLFFGLVQYLNVMHEISIIFPAIELSPVSRYFGPHRQIDHPQTNALINLSTIGNYEDSYTKGINITKESAPSIINSSQTKLCQLTEMGKVSLINKYKKYLRKYLKIKVEIKKIDGLAYAHEYEVGYGRLSGVPMRLSSGEKEFFNLIAGLILSGITNGIVLLDEPELHLHSQWQQAILDLIFNLSKDFNIQFFIVTHSPKFINEATLPHLFRVYMDGVYSKIIKPNNPTASNEHKDLVQFLNSTNNEKIFFSQKVILVEGISDQIIFSDIVQKLKLKLKSDIEVEILPAGSKFNLIKFRNLLKEWEIDNYIIADLDYIKDLRKQRNIIFGESDLKRKIIDKDQEINEIIEFSEKKLKEILCKEVSEDGKSMVKLIANKSKMTKKEFLEELDKLSDYLIAERAIALKSNLKLSTGITRLLNKIADDKNIFVLRKGQIEDYYHVSSNKIQNALEVIKTLNVAKLDPKIESFITRILS